MVSYQANEWLNINEIKNRPDFYELTGKNNNPNNNYSNLNNKNELNNSEIIKTLKQIIFKDNNKINSKGNNNNDKKI